MAYPEQGQAGGKAAEPLFWWIVAGVLGLWLASYMYGWERGYQAATVDMTVKMDLEQLQQRNTNGAVTVPVQRP